MVDLRKDVAAARTCEKGWLADVFQQQQGINKWALRRGHTGEAPRPAEHGECDFWEVATKGPCLSYRRCLLRVPQWSRSHSSGPISHSDGD